MCTYDGAAVGYCNKNPSGTTKTDLASYYYYFGDTITAGSELSNYADWCPTVSHSANRICSGNRTNGDAIVAGTDYTEGLGQDFSSNSKCFASTLAYTGDQSTYTAGTAGCYKFQCLSNSQMQVYAYVSDGIGYYTTTCTTATAGQSQSILGFAGSITCVDPADAAWCGSEQSFPSLTNMSVFSGSENLTPFLIPPFNISTTSYRLNLGKIYTSIGVNPTQTLSAATTMTFTDNSDVETVGDGREQYISGLQPNWNTFSVKIVTNAGQERTYSVGVTVGIGNNATKTIAITLNVQYLSITDWSAFRTEFKQELDQILAFENPITWAPTVAPSKAPTRVPSQAPTVTLSPTIAQYYQNGSYSPSMVHDSFSPSTAPSTFSPSTAPTVAPTVAANHVTLFQITSTTTAAADAPTGSIKVQFTLQYIDQTQPEPFALDATLQNLFNNKDSVMFKGDYRGEYKYLQYAAGTYASSPNVSYCDGGDNNCANEYCNVETGICYNAASDDDGFPEWAMYLIIAVGVMFGGLLLFCVGKKVFEYCSKNCCEPRNQRTVIDEETGEEIILPPRVTFPPIDRAAGKKEAAYMKLDKTTVPIMGAGHFSAAMDDESSDDEFSGQI